MYLTTLPPCGVHTLICYLRAYQQMIITLRVLRTTSDICLNHFLVSPSIPLSPLFRSTEYGEKRLMTKQHGRDPLNKDADTPGMSHLITK